MSATNNTTEIAMDLDNTTGPAGCETKTDYTNEHKAKKSKNTATDATTVENPLIMHTPQYHNEKNDESSLPPTKNDITSLTSKQPTLEQTPDSDENMGPQQPAQNSMPQTNVASTRMEIVDDHTPLPNIDDQTNDQTNDERQTHGNDNWLSTETASAPRKTYSQALTNRNPQARRNIIPDRRITEWVQKTNQNLASLVSQTGMARVSNRFEFNKVKKLCEEALMELKTPLPAEPDGIQPRIRNSLPFSLPIEDRRELRAAVASLRCIFTFNKLPDSYIHDKRLELPLHPDQLIDEANNNTSDTETLPTNENINDLLKSKQVQTEIIFPIVSHEQISEALEVLREHFPGATIPHRIFAVPDLLPPDWNIFTADEDNAPYEDKDTQMQNTDSEYQPQYTNDN
ncbi:8517_t:CDS:2 [Gigaspora margarita]|uniref:8517_t:CDS:1 n=1 Tax=Gigaspora margarita TaxID=4874 RepID=A0ABN7V214_GIGMA|nr:8517_t:CDS:2 [Gigaspora margarita]